MTVVIGSIHVHEDDIVGRQRIISNTGGRNQQARFPAHRYIAGHALIDAISGHGKTGADNCLAQTSFVASGHSKCSFRACPAKVETDFASGHATKLRTRADDDSKQNHLDLAVEMDVGLSGRNLWPVGHRSSSRL